MRRKVLILAAFAATTATACGGGDVVVHAQLEGEIAGAEEGEAVALGSLPVFLLPYDRDALFDSLTQAYPEPEPQLPDSIAALQDLMIEAQAEWREADSRWGTLRDSLQEVTEQMNALDESSGEYFALFQDYGDLEAEYDDAEDRAESAFEEFTSLQDRFTTQSQEIRLAQQNWGDEAFAPVDSIILARLDEMGVEERADTTSAQGVVRFTGVPEGEWWVHARYDRPYDELYWNEPVEVVRGEELVVQLTADNAEVRQKM